jgi:hypothetical protein
MIPEANYRLLVLAMVLLRGTVLEARRISGLGR